jgi:hypothetical protein
MDPVMICVLVLAAADTLLVPHGNISRMCHTRTVEAACHDVMHVTTQANRGIDGWPSDGSQVTVTFPVLLRVAEQEDGGNSGQRCRASLSHEHVGAATEDDQARLKRMWQQYAMDLGKHPTEMVGHEALDPSSATRALWDAIFYLQVPCTSITRL